MEKSKRTLTKTRKIIFCSILIIMFLESDYFAPIRATVSSFLVFFQGKGTLISNIFIGILGSAVLTYVSEKAEYKVVKRRLQKDILRVYSKWNREIEPLTSKCIDDIECVELISKNIYQYCEEIHLLYNTYLSYSKNDTYISLLRPLYNYTSKFKDYLDYKQYNQGVREFFLSTIESLKKFKSDDPEKNKSIDEDIVLIQKDIQDIEQKLEQHLGLFGESKEELINSINEKRNELNDISFEYLDEILNEREAEHFDNEKNFPVKVKFKIKKCLLNIYLPFRSIPYKISRCLLCFRRFLSRSKWLIDDFIMTLESKFL